MVGAGVENDSKRIIGLFIYITDPSLNKTALYTSISDNRAGN